MVEETQSSNRNLITILALGAILLALAVTIIVAFVVLGGGESAEGASIESAKLVPADTFMYMVFNPHLDQAEHFEVLDRAWGDEPIIKEGLADMLESMQAEGVDYKADIESWMGDEIAFAMGANVFSLMDGAVQDTFEQIEQGLSGESVQPAAPTPEEVPDIVFVAATTDTAASDKFLDKLRAETEEDGTAFEETEYQGIKIVYQESEMAYATVDNFVVLVAGGLEPMQEIIDAREGGNLAGNQNYQDVMDKLPAGEIGYAYVDVGTYLEAVLEMAEPEMADIPPELLNLDQARAFKGAGFSVGLESDGLRVDFVTTYDREALPEDAIEAAASPNEAVERVPEGTLFYLSGTGLGQGLQQMIDALRATPEMAEDFDEQMQMLSGMLGVSVEELVEMLSGEFALAATHDPAGIAGDPSAPVGVSFLIEAQDQEKFERLIKSVSSLLAMGAELQFSEQTINDVEVTGVPNPATGEMVVGWGVGQGYFAIGSNQELLEAAFGGADASLSDDATYKATTAHLPDTKTGLFYMSVEGIMEIAVEAMGPGELESFNRDARPLFEPIKAMGAAGEPVDKDDDFAVGRFFILMENE